MGFQYGRASVEEGEEGRVAVKVGDEWGREIALHRVIIESIDKMGRVRKLFLIDCPLDFRCE